MSGISGPHVLAVADPLGSGKPVLKFDINDRDVPYSGSTGARGDIHSPQLLAKGGDFYVSIPLMFPQNFPTINSAWFQVAEIYGPPTGAAPPIGIDLYHTSSGDHLAFARGGYGQVMQFPTLTRNHWHTVVLHFKMATDSTGYVQAWYDGVQQKALGGSCAAGSTTCYYPTMASHNSAGPNWLQIDSYRKYGGYPGDVTLYHGAPAIGSSYAAVMSTVTNAPYGP